MTMFLNTKHDICKVVQQEIDDGDTCALYGMQRKVEMGERRSLAFDSKEGNALWAAPKFLEGLQGQITSRRLKMLPAAHVHAEWRPFTETPPQNDLYEVLWSDGALKGFSVFESGCWRLVAPHVDLAIAGKGMVSRAILIGQVFGWRPVQKEP
jgi:hypothetical protein